MARVENTVEMSKEAFRKLLDNQRKMAEQLKKADEREKERRRRDKEKKQWWAWLRVKATSAATTVMNHPGAQVALAGVLITSGVAGAVAGNPWLAENGILAALAVLGSAASALGGAAVAKDGIVHALNTQKEKDQKLLPAETEKPVGEDLEEEEVVTYDFNDLDNVEYLGSIVIEDEEG